jgi:hypothetical protein
MQSSTVMRKSLLLLTLGLTFAQANATEIFDPSLVSSNIVNSSSVRIDATIFSTAGSASPFTINVFAGTGECVRLDVAVQPTDLEMVVVAPDGSVYRNDDRPGDTRPLVQIPSAPGTGWYTVHLAHFIGNVAEGDLAILYGRYTAGSANCGQPTPVLNTQAASLSAMFEEESNTNLKKQAESAKPANNNAELERR